MITITNDREFRAALGRHDATRQRLLVARFVENVLPLCTDEQIARMTAVSSADTASAAQLATTSTAMPAAARPGRRP